MKITKSTTKEKLGQIVQPIDSDLVVVSVIVNALRTLEGGWPNNEGYVSTSERRAKAISMAADYLGI